MHIRSAQPTCDYFVCFSMDLRIYLRAYDFPHEGRRFEQLAEQRTFEKIV